jgi:hypothetical protein
MDIRPLLPLYGGVVTLGFTAILLVILHSYAVRHGGSLLNNLGARGFVIAFEVVFAAGLFSAVIMAVLVTPYNVPVDWTLAFTEGPALGILGIGVFFLAWRTLVRSLPPGSAKSAQKG